MSDFCAFIVILSLLLLLPASVIFLIISIVKKKPLKYPAFSIGISLCCTIVFTLIGTFSAVKSGDLIVSNENVKETEDNIEYPIIESTQESIAKTIDKPTAEETQSETEGNTNNSPKIPSNIISAQKLYNVFTNNKSEYESNYNNKIIGVVGIMQYKNGKDSTELTIRSGNKDITCYCTDGYSAEPSIPNKSIVIIYGTCKSDDNSYYVDECYYVEETTEDILISMIDDENTKDESNLVADEVEEIDYDSLSEEEYKDLCTEMWHDDIFFSKEDLNGDFVKLDLFLEELKFFDANTVFDDAVSEFIKQYDLQRDAYACGVRRNDTEMPNYMMGQIYLYFPKDCGYSASDFKEGDHIILYGKIIEYSTSTWDDYNYCGIIPKYIENNGQ